MPYSSPITLLPTRPILHDDPLFRCTRRDEPGDCAGALPVCAVGCGERQHAIGRAARRGVSERPARKHRSSRRAAALCPPWLVRRASGAPEGRGRTGSRRRACLCPLVGYLSAIRSPHGRCYSARFRASALGPHQPYCNCELLSNKSAKTGLECRFWRLQCRSRERRGASAHTAPALAG